MGTGRFAHQALPYESLDDVVARVVTFLQPAVATGAPALVVLDADKHGPIRDGLGASAENVSYLDVRTAGRNPAHLIPLWRGFLDEAHDADEPGPRFGVAEVLWDGRSPAEAAECRRYEALVHLALAPDADFRLLCPIDVSRLATDLVGGALTVHPELYDPAARARANAAYAAVDPQALLAEPLGPAPVDAEEFRFTDADLRELRRYVATTATDVGFGRDRTDDLVLAVDEVATNSYRYGGGGGVLRTWVGDGRLVLEVRDRGRFTDPLVGQLRPSSTQVGGRGLWIANQVCDLVQVRSTGEGAVVRLHARP